MLFGKKVEITSSDECKGLLYQYLKSQEFAEKCSGEKMDVILSIQLGKKTHGAFPLEFTINNLQIGSIVQPYYYPDDIYIENPNYFSLYCGAFYKAFDQYFTENGYNVYMSSVDDSKESWDYKLMLVKL